MRYPCRLRDEEGVALITALLLSMVIVTIGTTAVGLAIHNSEQGTYDRRRVQGVAAAEAGLNRYFHHLQDASVDTFQCSIQQSLGTTPVASFTASVTFYDAASNALPCPLSSAAADPAAALITSVGTSGAGAPARTMQAYVNLIPVVGGALGDHAVFSEGTPQFNSNVQVIGTHTNDANVYTNGSLEVKSNSVVHGNLYVQGNVVLDSNAEVRRSVWAGGSVQMNSNSRVLEDVTSSTSSISLDRNAHVYGDARAGTSITVGSNAAIDGLQVPNAPSDLPPQEAFPTFTFDAADWIEAGYQVQTFTDCAAAKSAIGGLTAGDWVIRIEASCLLSWETNEAVTVRGNLAIISDGGLLLNSNSRIQSDGAPHDLFLIFGLGLVNPCDIEFRSNSSIGSDLNTLIYTPCRVIQNSNSFVVQGQIFGGAVSFNSNSSLTYRQISVPGVSSGSFEEDIVYIREVVTAS